MHSRSLSLQAEKGRFKRELTRTKQELEQALAQSLQATAVDAKREQALRAQEVEEARVSLAAVTQDLAVESRKHTGTQGEGRLENPPV